MPLFHRHEEIVQREADIIKADAAMRQAVNVHVGFAEQIKQSKNNLTNALTAIGTAQVNLNEILSGQPLNLYRAEKDALLRELTLLARIIELENYRTKLEDGKPCPLCGSVEHPYAEGNTPVLNETEKRIGVLTEIITKAEQIEAFIRAQKEAEGVARQNLVNIELREAFAAKDREVAEKKPAELRLALQQFRTDFAELKQVISTKLQPLGITEIPDNGAHQLFESLKGRLDAWQSWIKYKADIEKQILGIGSEVGRLGAIIETQQAALMDKHNQLEVFRRERASASYERSELYGDKNTEDEVRRLNQAITDAGVAEKSARALHSSAQLKLSTSITQIETLKNNITQRASELAKLEQEFSTAIESANFSHETQFLSARLTNEQRSQLISTSKAIDDGLTAIKARHKDRETNLVAERSKKITSKSIEELGAHLQELGGTQKEIQATIASLNHRLSENTRIKEQIKAKETAIEAQKTEFLRWDNLHTLIGSSDGKKYRNFAQGLSFDIMVGRANQQLQKMTDRYLLIRDKERPLNLNVIDNYQAGEIRSTANLSGGEGFIVSMALALGLSHMASKNVKVDSLFLDEGFGTLDEEALDTALETLTALQQDGKLIGVISHVPTLKERISVQIEVTPQIGGRSQLSGYGCRCNGSA